MSDFASAQVALNQNSKLPITILANQLTVFSEENKGLFEGNVKIVQGNVGTTSNRMIVYYNENNNKGLNSKYSENEIKKIELFGDVEIKTPKETAKGDFGFYEAKSSTFILTGKVILMQNKNIFTGNKFTYNRITGKSTLSGESNASKDSSSHKRAKAIILPE